MNLGWLKVGLLYYVLIYMLVGGVLVEWIGLLEWNEMASYFLGCLTGHWLCHSDTMRSH